MISRRSFVAAAAAALATPAIAYEVDPVLRPQRVGMNPTITPGQILILPAAHFLYFVDQPGSAMRYGVGLGKAGQEISGEYYIGAKKEWPTWRPTDEMIKRDPSHYTEFINNDYVQPGGPTNPLGSRALYLFRDGRDTFNRIHGTTAPSSIGRSVSNGCVRMINEHVNDLFERVPMQTKVTVL
jgi:lipoprotein-anchoring transpeptidase ErfK/SrfK